MWKKMKNGIHGGKNNAKVKENEQGNTKKGNEVCIGNEWRRSVCRNYETVYQCWNRKQKTESSCVKRDMRSIFFVLSE